MKRCMQIPPAGAKTEPQSGRVNISPTVTTAARLVQAVNGGDGEDRGDGVTAVVPSLRPGGG